MLVVDDHGTPVRVHVDAVDAAHEVGARVGDVRAVGPRAAKAQLEAAWLEAPEAPGLERQGAPEVTAQIGQTQLLGRRVRDERLRRKRGGMLTLVHEVTVDLEVDQLLRMREVLPRDA